MPIGDVFRAVIHSRLDNQLIYNILYYRLAVEDVNAGPADVALANYVDAQIAPKLKAVYAAPGIYDATSVQKISPLPATVPQVVAANAGTGGGGATSIPTECAIVLTKRTSFAGRAYRGRFYVTAVPFSWVTASALDPTRVINYKPLVDALGMIQQGGGPGWQFQPVLWHVAKKNTTDITYFQLQTTIRSQRRRQIGKGK